MIEIKATVNVEGVENYLGELRSQIPKRVGFALNQTANDIQQGIRDRIGSSDLILRQPAFILKTVYRKPGEDFPNIAGGDLTAAVRIDESRDFLAKHEDGGVKSEEGGGLRAGGLIAVPIVRMRNPRQMIRRSSPLFLGKLPSGLFDPKAREPRSKFFGIVSRRGIPLILQRTGRKGQKAAQVIYALLRSVPIKARLGFHETANRVFGARWNANLQRELDEAIRRAQG